MLATELKRNHSLSFDHCGCIKEKINTFNITVISYNAEVNLSDFQQLAKQFNSNAHVKIGCPSFMHHHFAIWQCIYFKLSFNEFAKAVLLVKQFSFINRNIFGANIPDMVQHFPTWLFVTVASNQSIQIHKIN